MNDEAGPVGDAAACGCSSVRLRLTVGLVAGSLNLCVSESVALSPINLMISGVPYTQNVGQ